MKIKQLLLISFGLLFLLFLAVSAHFQYGMSKKLLEDQYYGVLDTRVTYRVKHITTFINLNKDKLNLISSRTQLRTLLSKEEITDEDKEKISVILDDARNSVDNFESVSILDNSGKVFVSTNKLSVGNTSPLWSFAEQKEDNEGVFIIKDNFGKPSLYFTGPIKSEGRTLGTLFIKGDLSQINSILSSFGNSGEVFLINSDGYFLTPSRFLLDDAVLRKNINTNIFQSCLEQRNEYLADITKTPSGEENRKNKILLYEDYRGANVLGSEAYIPEGDWCLIVKMDESEVVSPALSLLFSYIVISVAVTFFYLILLVHVSNHISKPIEKLNEGVLIVEKGDLDYKVGTASKSEIGTLSRSFDKMVAAVRASRKEIEEKVEKQTEEIKNKAKVLDEQRKAILNVLEDVSEEKEIASKERDKVNAILQSIGDGVFVVDSDLKIVLINKVALDLCGYTEDAIGKKYNDVLKFEFENHSDTKDKTNDIFIKNAIRTGRVQEMANHTVLVNRYGKKIPVADSASPLVDKKGKVTGCVVVFRDVGKEREIDRMKSEFLSVASHQLRTPLGSMRWNLEMLLSGDFGKVTPEQKEVLLDVYESDKRMVLLVDDLLNVSRIDDQRVSDNPEKTDIKKIVKQAVAEMEPIARQKNIGIKVKYKDNLPVIFIDSKRLREVVQNLLSNAVKYNTTDGKVEVNIKTEEKEIIISVSDTGMGIPKKDQDKIFAKFFRAANAVAGETEGSGLGLFVVSEYVKGWGGTITFSSVEGKGSTFEIIIPKKPKAHVLDTNLKNEPHKLV